MTSFSPGTEPAGGDDGAFDLFGVEKNLLPGAGLFEGQGGFAPAKTLQKIFFGHVDQHPVLVADKVFAERWAVC